MGGAGTDASAPIDRVPGELPDVPKPHQNARREEPLTHQQEQRLPAADDLGLVADLVQEVQGLLHARRRQITLEPPCSASLRAA